MKDKFAIIGLGLIFAALSFGITHSCREYRINNCEDKGGTAVIPPWFSSDPSAVSCIVVEVR